MDTGTTTHKADSDRSQIPTMCLSIVLWLLPTVPALAEVTSETIFFLQPDGHHYLLERAIHSDNHSQRFHLPKDIRREDLLQISPARYDWDDSDTSVNTLTFDTGGFSLIYPGRFNEHELQQDSRGEWHFRSWDGTHEANGRYGYWYSPGNFDRYTFTWILPDNIELLRYRSNRKGTWTRHTHAISFYAEKVNNLTFEIDYRVQPPHTMTSDNRTDEPRSRTTASSPPKITEPRQSTVSGDSDRDGVKDVSDLCPDTQAGALVDQAGCTMDADHDGIPDGVDRCLATPEGTPVDSLGCPR